MDNKEFRDKYFVEPSKEWVEAQERAFNAALAYEKNCIAKYDYVDMRSSRPPKRGETMQDFAFKYGTTVNEMKNQRRQVESALANER